MNAYAAYRALNAEQKQLLKTKQVAGARPPGEWLALLAPLAAYDRSGEKLRKLGCVGSVISGLLLGGALFLLVTSPVVGLLLLVFTLPLFVFAVIIYLTTSKLDIAIDLHKFVLPFLTVLRADVAADQPVQLALDMRGPLAKEKQVSQSAPYAAGAYHKIIATFFQDPWFSGDTILVDGSRLSWRVVERVRKLQKTKRNARGKTKWKTRHKQKTHLAVQLALRADRYALQPAAGAQRGDRIEAVTGEKWHTIKLHRVVQTDGLAQPNPDQLLSLIAAGFNRATPRKGIQ